MLTTHLAEVTGTSKGGKGNTKQGKKVCGKGSKREKLRAVKREGVGWRFVLGVWGGGGGGESGKQREKKRGDEKGKRVVGEVKRVKNVGRGGRKKRRQLGGLRTGGGKRIN